MTDMLDIARSGLMAYRTALAVTADNVANVETEGYRRRDISTIAAAGARATATSRPSGGQGVSITDIRRAFDGLAAERARTASATAAAATARLDGAAAIETLMIPGENGIDGTLRSFFDALADLSANPTDRAQRSLVLAGAEAVADTASGLAVGLTDLRAGLVADAASAATSASGILDELATLARSMTGAAGGSGLASLADRRDGLLDNLAEIIPISVTLDRDGRPTVRLRSAAGPLLLTGDRAATLSTGADGMTLRYAAADGATGETRALDTGRLGGLSDSLASLDMAEAELDAWARDFASALNALHGQGVDLAGNPGEPLFTLDGWQATPAAANGGRVEVSLAATEPAASEVTGAYTLVWDGPAAVWRASDADGTEIAAGSTRLALPGVTIDLAGMPRNGDRLVISPVTGRARDLALAVSDPARLAAAAAQTAAPAATNQGTAILTVGPALAASPLALVAEQFASGTIGFSGTGIVGLVPAGSAALTLTGLGEAPATLLNWQAGAASLAVTLDGATRHFDLSGFADAGAAVVALNAGWPGDGGASLSSLGLTAGLRDGALALFRPGAAAPVPASLDGVAGLAMPGSAAGGTIQIITRDGRHLAGAALSAEAAAALLTEANGFRAGAVYDASALRTGYRGMTDGGVDLPGMQALTLAAPAPVTGAAPLPVVPARNLTLASTTQTATVALPDGASAALIAERLTGALPGVSATATTALVLSDLPPGPLTLTLTGASTTPQTITATIGAEGGAAALAQAINAVEAATGVRAELSPRGGRLLLVQEAGHDITLSASAAIRVAPAGPDGVPMGAAALLTSGETLRQGGQVVLSAPQPLTLTDGGISVLSSSVSASAPTTSQAGATSRLTFPPVPDDAAGGQLYRLEAGGQTVQAALPPGTEGAAVAGALAADLRAGAPDLVLTGAPLPTLPAEGTTLAIRLEGADYQLTITDGQPVLSGPEAGRITAAFNSENQLVLRAAGVTGGGGLTFAPNAGLGLAAGQGSLQLTGQPPVPAALPATLSLRLAGAEHQLTLTSAGVSVAADFPGHAEVGPDGRLVLTLPAPTDGLRLGQSSEVGFGTQDMAVHVSGNTLVLTQEDTPVGARLTVAGEVGQSVTLTELPPEDLIVAVTGQGSLRLSGTVAGDAAGGSAGALEIEILDAAQGYIALRDRLTGDRIATATLDAAGRASVGGLNLSLTGTLVDGDVFTLSPTGAGSGDASVARALAELRSDDAGTGRRGLVNGFTALQSAAGVRVNAAQRSAATATAAADATSAALAAIGAVDLDAEAARLLQLQQGYQASAQALGIARDLFQTLLTMF